MKRIWAIGLLFSLAACSGGTGSIGSFNPLNWFRTGTAATEAGAPLTLAPRRGYGFVTDTRPLIARVSALAIDRTASGAIIRATGLPPTLGYYDADLVQIGPVTGGVITFEFRVRPPASGALPAPASLREITVATRLTSTQLAKIRSVRVIAAGNSRTARR